MKRVILAILAITSLTPGIARAIATPVPRQTMQPVTSVAASPTPAASPVVAGSNLPTPTPAVGKVAASLQAAHLANLKTRGAAEISRRLTALTAAQTALGNTTKLTPTDKTTLTAQLKAETDSLFALQTKLAADSTLDAARVDVQSIITDYRVFALMLPKARLITTVDNFQTIEDQLNGIAHSLQADINKAKTAGTETTSAQATLNELENKLNAARLASTGLTDKVINLSPTDYNANHALLTTDRQALVTARDDLKAARADVTTVLSDLKSSAK